MRAGIAIARDSAAWTIAQRLIGLAMFGLLALLMSTPAVPNGLDGH